MTSLDTLRVGDHPIVHGETSEDGHSLGCGRSCDDRLWPCLAVLNDQHPTAVSDSDERCGGDQQAFGGWMRNDIDIDRLAWP